MLPDVEKFRLLNASLYVEKKRTLRNKAQVNAMHKVSCAVLVGELIRPTTCQVCGAPESKTVAHHWRGYDFPLDVWFVCPKCNNRLHAHDGSVSLEQARAGY
jgi:DNA-directed RNA polymerase subunit M/transcription elongation factor TFIIS